MEKNMGDGVEFFVTTMPDTRPADYCLGYLEGAVFIDFDNYKEDLVRLKRISFDGYGCCELSDRAIPMNGDDSLTFKKMIKAELPDQSRLAALVKKTILNNREFIWEDALKEYTLL
ncbi:hypothetical protein [Ferruginibacter sp. SUN106]|uniref:hypothetical protein n=1 Tax=Ferruginibacter sp. SUN106 TaxID=2978348 RepID=UPI003D35DF8E